MMNDTPVESLSIDELNETDELANNEEMEEQLEATSSTDLTADNEINEPAELAESQDSIEKDELQKKLAHMEEEAKAAATRLEQLESHANLEAAELVDPETGAPLVEPNEQDYQTGKEYLAALRAYSKKELHAKQHYLRQQQEHRDWQAQVTRFQQQEEQARKQHTDYDAVAHANIPVNELMGRTIMSLQKGPEVLYWLGQHPAEAERLARLSTTNPLHAVTEIGKLEYKLGEVTLKVSQTPKPIKPVGSSSLSERSPENMSLSELQAFLKKG